jgi:hypothetical protein
MGDQIVRVPLIVTPANDSSDGQNRPSRFGIRKAFLAWRIEWNLGVVQRLLKPRPKNATICQKNQNLARRQACAYQPCT